MITADHANDEVSIRPIKKREKDEKKEKKKKEKKRKRSKHEDEDDSRDYMTHSKSESYGILKKQNTADLLDEKSTNETKTQDESFIDDPAVKEKKQSNADFFSKLLAEERSKPSVGTVHATSRKDDGMNTADKSRNWTCYKCDTSNIKDNQQCSKCKSMKRMTEYR